MTALPFLSFGAGRFYFQTLTLFIYFITHTHTPLDCGKTHTLKQFTKNNNNNNNPQTPYRYLSGNKNIVRALQCWNKDPSSPGTVSHCGQPDVYGKKPTSNSPVMGVQMYVGT